MKHSHFDTRRYVIGIQYNSSYEDRGFFDIQRISTLRDLALEVNDYLLKGKSSYPAFPPEANPEILYVWDLDDPEDGDCYHELMNEIKIIQSHINRRR
ncbi:MAG: hypothetical protein V3U16_07750 [Candidatus Neomarinimicrobiota bacterium]